MADKALTPMLNAVADLYWQQLPTAAEFGNSLRGVVQAKNSQDFCGSLSGLVMNMARIGMPLLAIDRSLSRGVCQLVEQLESFSEPDDRKALCSSSEPMDCDCPKKSVREMSPSPE